MIFLSTPALGASIAEYASRLSLNPQFADTKPADFNAFPRPTQQLQTVANNIFNLMSTE